MNRAPFLLACTSLDDLVALLPAKALVGIVSMPGDHMLCATHGECLLHLLASGLVLDGVAGKWELYLLLPHNCGLQNDFDSIGPKTQRAMQRFRIASPKLRGPWSIPQFAALFPTAAKEIPKLYDAAGKLQSPLVYLGDDSHVCGAVDYHPTDLEAMNDTPTDTAKLYADARATAGSRLVK